MVKLVPHNVVMCFLSVNCVLKYDFYSFQISNCNWILIDFFFFFFFQIKIKKRRYSLSIDFIHIINLLNHTLIIVVSLICEINTFILSKIEIFLTKDAAIHIPHCSFLKLLFQKKVFILMKQQYMYART